MNMNKIKKMFSHSNKNEQEVKPFNLMEQSTSERDNDELIKEFRDAKIVNGTAQEFFDFSMNFVRNEKYQYACEILRRGLEYYAYDADLSACYLNCVTEGGVQTEKVMCENVYKKIRSKPLEGFSEYTFDSILRYLAAKKNAVATNECKKIESDAEEIIKVFQKQYPKSEGSYFAHYKFIDGAEEQKAKLQEAVEKLSSCPRCALRLAEILCNEGDYNNSCNNIDKCLRSIQTRSDVNKAFVYYLRAICEYGVFQSWDLANKNSEDIKLKVQKIYESFKIAKSEYYNLHSSYSKESEKIIFVLEKQTEIPY